MSFIKEKELKSTVSRKQKYIAVAVVLLLVSVVAIAVFLALSRQAGPTAEEQIQAFEKTNDTANAHSYNENYKQEAEAYKQFLDEQPKSEKTDIAMIKLATARMNSGEYDAAIEWYEKVRANGGVQKLAAVEGLALAYTAKKEYRTAIKYWREASQVARETVGNGAELLIYNHNEAIERLETRL